MFRVIKKEDGQLYCNGARAGETILPYTNTAGQTYLLKYSVLSSWGAVWDESGERFSTWLDPEFDKEHGVEYSPLMTEHTLIKLFEQSRL